MLTSCSEGKYWDEPSSLNSDAMAFPKPSDMVVIPADGEFPSTYDIQISRSNDASEKIVPVVVGKVKSLTNAEIEKLKPNEVLVEVEGKDEPVVLNTPVIVYTVKSPEITTSQTEVKFEKGKFTAPLKVDIDTKLVEPGYKYDAMLTVLESRDMDMSVNSKNLKLNFSIRQAVILKWEDAGTALLTSSLIGNKQAVEVPVQVASNYPDKKFSLYRLVSPYAALDPEAEKGFDIEFLCHKGSLRAASSPVEGWQQSGLKAKDSYGDEVNVYLGSQKDIKSSFKNKKKLYMLVETVGYNAQSGAVNAQPATSGPNDDLVTETLSFTWNF